MIRAPLRKDARLQSLFLQEALAYRIEGAVWFLFDILPPFTMVFLWLSAYGGQATVAGYSLPAMIGYYLIVTVLRTVLTPYPEYDIARQVREGTISQHLVRPLSIWLYYLFGELAWKVVRTALLIPVMIVAVILLRSVLVGLDLTPGRVLAFLAATAISFVLTYLLKMTLAWSSFWLTESSGLFELFELITMVFGGLMIPIEILPGPAQAVAALLPFQYLYAFPAQVLLGRVEGIDLAAGFAIQAAWLVAIAAFSRWLWRRALIRYEAVGG
jgi:ABC-2 type transport system permease protein